MLYSFVSPPASSPSLSYTSNYSILSAVRITSRSNHSFSHHHFNTSITAAKRAAMIYSTRVVLYGSTNSSLKLPVTNSSAQRVCLLMAAMTSSMAEALLGAI